MEGRRDEADAPQLLTALTTEHFTLQGARSQTMSESSARASVFVFSVSSTLVALGFVAQISQVGDAFDVFALTILPSGHDDGRGVFANMGLTGGQRTPLFAFSSAIAVIDGVVGGSAVAIALGALVDASLGLAAAAGAVAAIASIVVWIRYALGLLAAGAAEVEPLFPSPAAESGRR